MVFPTTLPVMDKRCTTSCDCYSSLVFFSSMDKVGRMAYELMQVYHFDAWQKYHSLDAGYYFHGMWSLLYAAHMHQYTVLRMYTICMCSST